MMPTFTCGVVYLWLPELIMPISVMIFPFLFFSTFVVPVASISMLKVLGSIESLHMKTRQERVMPFLFITLFYAMTAYTFIFKIQVSHLVAVIFVSASLLVALISIITLWFKISVHAAAMAGLSGYLLSLAQSHPSSGVLVPFFVCIILSGLVMSARLYLRAHSPKEIWIGAAVGFALCFCAIKWFG